MERRDGQSGVLTPDGINLESRHPLSLSSRFAAAKALNEKTGSFKGWADDAKAELNGQLKKQVEESLNIDHFKDFKVSLLSRPLREWYQQQQEILQLLPVAPPAPGATPVPALPAK